MKRKRGNKKECEMDARKRETKADKKDKKEGRCNTGCNKEKEEKK